MAYRSRDFSKEESQIVERHLKNCSTFLDIREMQIKTTLIFHITSVRMVMIKIQVTAHAGEDVEQGEHSSTAGARVNL